MAWIDYKKAYTQGYTHLGIVELDKIKEHEIKEKIIKEYKRRLRLILNSKLKVIAINTLEVAIFRHGAGILQWKESELKNVDGKSRKTMTMYDRRLVSQVGKAPICCAGGSGSIRDRTTTQGLKIIEEKVLPLL